MGILPHKKLPQPPKVEEGKCWYLGAPANREDLRRGLAALIETTQVEAGCIDCRLHQESSSRPQCLSTFWTVFLAPAGNGSSRSSG